MTTTMRRLDFAFLVLLVGTGITWWLGESGHTGPAAVVAILAIAAIKGVLIVREFMALRGIGFFWPAMVTGWLILVLGIIVATYWKGM